MWPSEIKSNVSDHKSDRVATVGCFVFTGSPAARLDPAVDAARRWRLLNDRQFIVSERETPEAQQEF